MLSRWFNFGKRGSIGVDDVLKWILYLAILGAVSYGVWRIVSRF